MFILIISKCEIISSKRWRPNAYAKDYINAVLRTALKRKARKLAKDYMNAVLRTALKTREGLHKCCASHRIKNTSRHRLFRLLKTTGGKLLLFLRYSSYTYPYLIL